MNVARAPTASANRAASSAVSANGFSKSTALPAAAAAIAMSTWTAGGTQKATASQASSNSSYRENVGAPCFEASDSAASGRRAQTPASVVSGPAASTGPCTKLAHGPAPTNPTFNGSVVAIHLPAGILPFGSTLPRSRDDAHDQEPAPRRHRRRDRGQQHEG